MATAESFDLDDDRRLNLTQNTRERIVTVLLKDNKIPEDKEDRQFLMAALDGLDRTTLGRARIKTDAQSNKSNAETAGMIAQLLAKVTPGTMVASHGQFVRPAPALEVDFVVIPVEGECDVGTHELSYETFIEKMNDA